MKSNGGADHGEIFELHNGVLREALGQIVGEARGLGGVAGEAEGDG